jgi:hypothetical protein
MFKLFSELYAPVGITGVAPGGSVSGPALEEKSMSKEDMLDFLSEDEPPGEVIDLGDKSGKKTTPKDDKEKSEEGEETQETTGEEDEEAVVPDEDELADLEAELEPPTEDQLELVTPVRRKEILAKYPTLFKDFPYLEKAYYRDAAFTEMFTTPQEAKEAVEAKGVLDNFEKDVMSGNITTILKSVKQTDGEAFNNIADNYMAALHEADQAAYYHVIGNISKNTILAMLKEARAQKSEALESAATILNQFLFGNSEWKPPSNLSKSKKEDDGREAEIAKKEADYNRKQFEGARGELNTRVNSAISKTITANIDPKNTMTEFVRNAAIREVTDNLTRLIGKDARFTSLNDKLWEAGFKASFSQEAKDRIVRAYFSKAKTVLPALIKQARVNALRGMGKRVNASEQEEQPDKKGPIPSGRPRSQERSSGKIKEAKDIPKGMRTLDFLNQE